MSLKVFNHFPGKVESQDYVWFPGKPQETSNHEIPWRVKEKSESEKLKNFTFCREKEKV